VPVDRIWNGTAWEDVVSIPANMMTTDTGQTVTGAKVFTLATGLLAASGLLTYSDTSQHSAYVLATNGWPVDGLLTGYRYNSTGAQRLQASATGLTYARYWTGSDWSAWEAYLDETDLRAKGFSSGGVLNKKVMGSNAITATATASTFGMAAPTLAATATNSDDTLGPWVLHTTGSVIGNNSGYRGPSVFRRDWQTECYVKMRMSATITTLRNWVGLFSGDPTGSATPSLHLAAFRYDTVADGTVFWRCVTAAGSATQTVTTTTNAVTGGAAYQLGIVTSATDVKFYIAGLLVATHTTNLPTSSTNLAPRVDVTTLVAGARTTAWSQVELRSL
jgi:hypothetical protein